MGVYIKNMTLDEFSEYGDDCLTLIGIGQADEVPPHGRLIDMDALKHWILTEMACLDTEEDREFVADRLASELPTIIEAEREE